MAQALKKGTLVRPGRCENCGKECKPHAHHDDYAKPLEVRWLCPPCHRREPSGTSAGPGARVGISVRMEPELLARINASRGGEPREAWIRQAIEQRLSNRGPIPADWPPPPPIGLDHRSDT